MRLFAGCPGFQRLVGVCPERLCLVTSDAGRTLTYHIQSGSLNHEKLTILKKICARVEKLHQYDFVHNNLCPHNVCLKNTCQGV